MKARVKLLLKIANCKNMKKKWKKINLIVQLNKNQY